ncbi:hypothetical protein [Pseudoxanthomonas indica]|uniref:Uncharacterized protein n=1 Tax=Pseudoxanthomonas indica TaxID=428993 RepID=A0A1T5IJG1_9GAMM|nr:hypothetical protein [Pseudoxanthomonas indica]GGD52523.1 hypothetical protein GCM10007235_25920 [Pseudoxanthomonas indica]SKC39301.1 hypothetical protein SAMN06296058_0008 [Pseudoxanthomonas indica]
MDFKRILANAIARRVAYVLVALLLAWMGLGKAHAQATYPNQGAAYAGCNAGGAANMAGAPTVWAQYRCTFNPNISSLPGYVCEVQNKNSLVWGACALYGTLGGRNHRYPAAQTCSAKPSYTGSPPTSTAVGKIRNGSFTCTDGCTQKWHANSDGTFTGSFNHGAAGVCTTPELQEDCGALGGGSYWNAYIQACETPEVVCEEGQVKDAVTGACGNACPAGMKVNQQGQCEEASDTCPAGQIKSPQGSCLPGEGQCAAGEAPRENGTCGKDSDGDGKADEDDDNPDNDPDKETASGGDSCNAPPSCSGSAIACIQVKIQWRIDCNTRRRVNISGGGCAAMPVCTGDNCDALEYSQLLMQWRSTCALEKLNLDGGGGGSGETGIKDHMTALKQAEVDALRNLGTDDGHGNVDPNAIFHEFDNSDFNPNLFGGNSGGQCPVALTIGGKSIQFPAGFWSVAAFIGWLMVACAYLWVAFQLGS